MAETIRIEIPINATDNTSGAVRSAQRNMTALERSVQRTQRQLDRMDGSHCRVSLEADDSATGRISGVEDALSRANGHSAVVDVEANDAASGVISDVGDNAAALNGEDAVVDLEAEDAASGVISDVGDNLAEVNGETAVVDLEAEDAASGVIADVADSAADLDGRTVHLNIVADTTGALSDASDSITGALGAGGKKASGLVTAAAGFAGLGLGVGSALQSFGDFEAGMSQVAAISGATGSDLDDLTEKAKQMGASTKFTATQSAEAFNYMAMAGWKTEQMLDGIEGIMNLAAASGERLGTTSDIVTDALTAFGLGAGDSTHFADVMAQASANANTNVSMLGESFKYVAPVAGAMGYSIEDTALALGIMANSGVKASMAGTALRRTISSLTAPTDKQLAAMKDFKISLTDDKDRIKSLGEVMTDLRTNLSGLADDEKTAAINTMFGSQAMAGMLAIVNASEEDFEKLRNLIYHADGASARMAETMMDNMQGSLTLLSSAWEGTLNTLGGRLAPYVTDIAEGLTAAMPGITAAIEKAFDAIDPIVEGFKQRVGEMLSSDEWKTADGLDRINIAWDKLIWDPFSEWIGGEGKVLFGGGVRTLFEEAFGLFQGEGGLTNWASMGILAITIPKVAKGLSDAGAAIASFPPVAAVLSGFEGLAGVAGPAIAGAIGIGLAVAMISAAVENYNALEVKQNLAEHFGDLELSKEDAEALAGQVIPVEGLIAELHIAETKFDDAEALKEQAEKLLSETNELQWKIQKVSVTMPEGYTVPPEDLASLQSVADELKKALIEQFQAQEEGSESFVSAILGASDASGVIDTMRGWFEADAAQVQSLGDAVHDLLQGAIDSGVENVDTAVAVSIMQAKMMEIVNGARMAGLQGKLDWLDMTSTGAALTSDSWSTYVSAIGGYIQELMTVDQEAYSGFLGQLRQLEYNDPSRHGEAEAIRQLIREANDNLLGQYSTEAFVREYGSLRDAYGSELAMGERNVGPYIGKFRKGLDEIMQAVADAGGEYSGDPVGEWLNEYLTDTDWGAGFDSKTKGALQDRYEKMLPTVDALGDYMDTFYDEEGKQIAEIPQGVMDSYWKAMKLGAMTGDADASRAFAVKQLSNAFPTREDFDQFLDQSGTNLAQFAADLGYEVEDFSAYLNRAFAETGEGIDYSEMLNRVMKNFGGEEVDWANVESILNEYGLSIKDALEEQGIDIGSGEVPVKGEVTPDFSDIAQGMTNIEGLDVIEGSATEEGFVTVKVKPNYTLSGIAEDNGLDWSTIREHVLADNPEITDENYIEVDQEIKLRVSDFDVEMETGGIQEDVQAKMEESAGESVEVQTPVNAQGNLEETNAEQVYQEGAEQFRGAFDESINADNAIVNVTASLGSHNAYDVYNSFAAAAQMAFSAPIAVSATISVSATSTGGVGAGKSANGRFVNGPMLSWIGEDGPEYVIPVGEKRHSRGLDLWMQAGHDLGVPGFADGGVVGDEESMLINPFESRNKTPQEVLQGLFGSGTESSSAGSSQQGTGGVSVSVNLSPVIQIDGSSMDEEAVFNVMKNRIKEVADDVGYEVGEKLAKIFGNMPLAAGV